jgi:hypothetical protein
MVITENSLLLGEEIYRKLLYDINKRKRNNISFNKIVMGEYEREHLVYYLVKSYPTSHKADEGLVISTFVGYEIVFKEDLLIFNTEA